MLLSLYADLCLINNRLSIDVARYLIVYIICINYLHNESFHAKNYLDKLTFELLLCIMKNVIS